MKRYTLEKTITYRTEILAENYNEAENLINSGYTNSSEWNSSYHSPIKIVSVCNDEPPQLKMTDVEFRYPRYIEGGYYLLYINGNYKYAHYWKPRLTGNYSVCVKVKNGRFMLQPIKGSSSLRECEVTGITEEEFLKENGNGRYKLKELIDDYDER